MDQLMSSLKATITGEVILPEDASYDTLRQTKFNHTARPLAIVMCQTTDDVAAAINFAREHDLKLSVRSGGHSGAGLSTNDGGLVIDVSLLSSVEVLDEQDGIVRIGAGAQWGDVAQQLQKYNLAISSGDTTSVGVGGLALGGGIGWMVRTHGLAIDNVVAVELVTATGESVRATSSENTDLFWAVRGGGGNFGIATAFEFQAVHCAGIIGGKLVFSADDVKSVLTKWSEYMRTAPEELNTTAVLLPGFGPEAKPQVVVIVCYANHNEAAAQKAIQPLRELAPVVHDSIRPMPYAEMLEDAKELHGIKIRVRNGFIKKITPQLIDTLAESFRKPHAPIVQIRSLNGAMTRVPADATAFEHRDVEAWIAMNIMLPEATDDMETNRMADSLWQPLQSFVQGAYIGFQTDNSEQSTNAAYQISYQRLATIKATYDPRNIFNQNTNIKPTPQTGDENPQATDSLQLHRQ